MEASAPEMESQYETNQNYETQHETNQNHEEHYHPLTNDEMKEVEEQLKTKYYYNPEKKEVEEQIKTKYPYNPNMTLIPTNYTPNTYPPCTTTTPHLQNMNPKGLPNPQTDESQEQPPVSQTTPTIPVGTKAKAQRSNITEPHANQKPSRKNETKKSPINQINSTLILEALRQITNKQLTMDARFTRIESQLNRIENLIYNGEHLAENKIQYMEARQPYHYNRHRYLAQQDTAYTRANQY